MLDSEQCGHGDGVCGVGGGSTKIRFRHNVEFHDAVPKHIPGLAVRAVQPAVKHPATLHALDEHDDPLRWPAAGTGQRLGQVKEHCRLRSVERVRGGNQPQKLLARPDVGAEAPPQRRSNRLAVLLLDASHHHAQMVRLNDDSHPFRL